jgi:SAM-dependent methyltransferase
MSVSASQCSYRSGLQARSTTKSWYTAGWFKVHSRSVASVSSRPDRSLPTDTHAREWTDSETIVAWQTWARMNAAYTRPLTDLLLDAARVAPGMRVLDLASGSGEPALALARAVGPSGNVIASDISEAMLELVLNRAQGHGLHTAAARLADAEALPFANASFDRVTSRLGIMHVPDAGRALKEARRVLTPHGRAVFLVWGPPTEQTMMLHQAILARYVQTPPPSPDAPGPFRFAQHGTLAAAMLAAGFKHVTETTHRVALAWPGTAEEWWQQTREVAAPLHHLLASLPPAERAQIDQEVHARLVEHSKDGHITLQAVVHIASGLSGAAHQ